MAKDTKTSKGKQTEDVVVNPVEEKQTKKTKKVVETKTEPVVVEAAPVASVQEVVVEQKTEGKNKKSKAKTEDVVSEVAPSSAAPTEQTGGESKKTQKKGKSARSFRSFKAIYTNPDGTVVMEGRYCGAKPKQAACKALTGIYKIFKKQKKQINGSIYFGVKETTRKGRGKFYWYNGERICLAKPIEVPIKDKPEKPIVYRYNNSVKKAHEDECKDLLNYQCVDNDSDAEETVVKKQSAGTKSKRQPKDVKSRKTNGTKKN